MRNKMILLLFLTIGIFSASFTVLQYNNNLSAAGNLEVLEPGEQVIVGTNESGEESVWTVSKNNTGYYAMHHYIGTVQNCNSNTNNTVPRKGGEIDMCDFYTDVAGKSHSQGYLTAKSYDDAYTASLSGNEFESTEVLAVSGKVGNLQHGYVPGIDDFTSGSLGLDDLPEVCIISEKAYIKHNKAWQSAYFRRDSSVVQAYSSSSTNATAYPAYISYEWAYIGKEWQNLELSVFSHLKSPNILYALDHTIGKNVLKSNPRSGVLKIRYADPSYQVTFSDMQYKGNSIADKQVVKNAKIQLDATANDTLSVFVFNDAGNQLLYYKALNTKEFDLTGIPVGKYKIAVANEHFDASTGRAAKSSPISQMMGIEIVEPHKLAYTKDPQSGATAGDYEFSKNVNAGQKVGMIDVSPKGVMPLTYTIESNGDNTHQNFEIDGLDANDSSGSTSLDIKIKSNAPDLVNGGLKAGTYKFCIAAKDAYKDPDPATSNSRVCTTFDVAKTQPTIIFDQDDKGTTYVSGSTTGTTTHSEHATHTNNDLANNDVKIEYSFVSGNGNIISSGLPFTSSNAGDNADIVFAANATGSVVIQAKVDATDNYEAATTTKTITFQLGITANYVEDKTNITAGSSAAKPPTSYTSANKIAHIDVSGGTAPFTYTLPSGQGNNGSFHVDSNGNVYVNTSVGANGLTPGSYTIVVEVKDSTSPNKQTTTATKTITIQAASLSGVGWEEPQKSGSIIPGNTYTITYDPSGEPNNGGTFNTKLIETTNGALTNTVITYSLNPDPNDVISISGSSTVQATVKKASDSNTLNNVKIKAHITGGIYGTTGVDTDLIVNVNKYPQTIAFPDTSMLKLAVGGACVSVPASVTSTYSKSGETIQYTSSNTSLNAPFTINAQGQVCPTSNASDAGSATLTGTLNGDDNYETATTQTGRVIQVYVPGNIEVTGSIENGGTTGVTYTPDATLKKALNTSADPNGGTAKQGTAMAQVSVSGSTYKKSTNNGNQNADASLFTVTSTGYITLNQDITANDLSNHGTGNKYYIQVDVTDNNKNTRTVDVIIVIVDAQADFYFIDPIAGTKLALSDTYGTKNVPVYKKTYEQNGTIDVKTNIDSTYSEVTIAESTGISVDEDVIDHNNLNHFNIINASDPDGDYGNGGDAYVKACMNAHDGYAAQCIYAKIVIEKAEQKDFAFVNTPKWTIGKTPATIQPTYNGKLSQGDVLLSSSDNTIAEAQPPISGQDQSFKTLGKAGTATLTATSPEDRNYNSKQATTILETTDRPPTSLNLYAPGMTYGDTNIEAKITSGYKNGVPVYFYVDDTSILDVNTAAVNTKTSQPITAIGSGQVIIKVCQTKDAFDPAVDDCNAIGGDYGEQIIIVKKKPITLTYEDEEIYVGEAFPTYKFKQPSTNAFAFTDSMNDFPIPKNTSAKQNGKAIKDTKTTGKYDISGSYGTNELNGNTKHYEIKLESGSLTIKQDEPSDSWYHLEDPDGNTVTSDKWHNYLVDVVIDTANTTASAGVYDQISDTVTFTNANKQRFTINKEDDNETDIYFRIDPSGTSLHKGAISEKLQDHVKIDMMKPKIVSITGYPVNQDGVSNILNEITLGHYFKPGVQVEIKTEDPQPNTRATVKVSEVKEVSYQVYELDAQGMMTSTTPIEEKSAKPGTNKILSFKINNIGNYRVCATTIDNATNESEEKCSDLNIKKIDVDVDGDGKPDFNDPDGDGCPDLNIKWKDPNDTKKWTVINGDRDYDGIPDLNIDSDGDGKPDLNIDTDNDGKPDLNLVILKKSDWKPTKCVKQDVDNGILEEYCTGTSVKPLINIDTDGDRIPDIDIDTDGDMKPDINIQKVGFMLNVAEHDTWKPNQDYTSNKFLYDTEKIKPVWNIDTDGNGFPDVNVDIDGDGIPDLNIDTDDDGIPNTNIDSDGDGVADINIDKDGDGVPEDNIQEITEWKPNKTIQGDYPYDIMDFSEPNEPEDPENPEEPEEPNDPTVPKNDEPQADKLDTSVKGMYNPVTSMGGANTGDATNLMMYSGLCLFSFGITFYLLYKRKTSHLSE